MDGAGRPGPAAIERPGRPRSAWVAGDLAMIGASGFARCEAPWRSCDDCHSEEGHPAHGRGRGFCFF